MGDAAQPELDALEASWATRGVEFDAYISKDSWDRRNLHLSRIVIERGHRGQGLGTRAMEDLTALADRRGLLMTLSPSMDFGGSSVERLKRFYRRFGFVSNKGRHKDFTLSDAMYRLPAPIGMGAHRSSEGSEGTAYIDKSGGRWTIRWWSQDERRYYNLPSQPTRDAAVSYARSKGYNPVVAEPHGLGDLKTRSKHPIPVWPEFVDAYLEAALWASASKDEEPLDVKYTVEDYTQEAIDKAVQDSNDFVRANRRDLQAASSNKAQHGYDFFLTRNYNGAGFWDRGYGAFGERLTKSAHAFGSVNAYAGKDGKIRFE